MDIITTHKNTDFDALASVMAANLIYPDARCILPKSLNPNVRAFLSIHKDVFTLHEFKDLDLDGSSFVYLAVHAYVQGWNNQPAACECNHGISQGL